MSARRSLSDNGLCKRLEVRWPWVLSSRLQAPFFGLGAGGRDHFCGGSDSAATVSAPWGEMVLVKFMGPLRLCNCSLSGLKMLLRKLAADCPKRKSLSAYDLCGVHCPELSALFLNRP